MSLVATALYYVEFIDASVPLLVIMFISFLVPVTIIHGALAGEREKRTLDLLLVAPVTERQIVFAKFSKSILPSVILLFVALIPAAILAFARIKIGQAPLQAHGNIFLQLTLAGLLIATTTFFISAMALAISGINRTTSNAMTSSLGALFLLYILMPIMVGMMEPINPNLPKVLGFVHPFVCLSELIYSNSADNPGPKAALVCAGLHVVMGLIFLHFTTFAISKERQHGMKDNA